MFNSSLFSSASDDWSTPDYLFQELDSYFHFDLDPCASDFNHKCPRYFTKDINGLDQDWFGTVFCNPPYGRSIGKWVKKGYDEFTKHGSCVVFLLPARTDTSWFHDYLYNKADVYFLRGRLRFNNYDQPAPFPSMICVLR